jgi:hypothetical protein
MSSTVQKLKQSDQQAKQKAKQKQSKTRLTSDATLKMLKDSKLYSTLFGHPGWALILDEFDFKTEGIKEGFTSFGIDPTLLAFGQGGSQCLSESSRDWPQ